MKGERDRSVNHDEKLLDQLKKNRLGNLINSVATGDTYEMVMLLRFSSHIKIPELTGTNFLVRPSQNIFKR